MIEEIQLGGSSIHMEIDEALGTRCEMWETRQGWMDVVSGLVSLCITHEAGQSDTADLQSGSLEKLSPRPFLVVLKY